MRDVVGFAAFTAPWNVIASVVQFLLREDLQWFKPDTVLLYAVLLLTLGLPQRLFRVSFSPYISLEAPRSLHWPIVCDLETQPVKVNARYRIQCLPASLGDGVEGEKHWVGGFLFPSARRWLGSADVIEVDQLGGIKRAVVANGFVCCEQPFSLVSHECRAHRFDVGVEPLAEYGPH